MGTKDCPGKYDCYEAAANDEPMFILLARDASAPDLVRSWAMQRELERGDMAKVDEARDCARAMDEWLEHHPTSDTPAVGS